ncbi:MAG: DODA-type extradiol aromatic ring-opening family dioxygenase [Acidobacteriaceae bacterium]
MTHTPAIAAMPSIFLSHGSPMTAIESGPYQDALARFGREHRPTAIVVVSGHWEMIGPIRITSAQQNTQLYDFGGFPRALYALQYTPPGSPMLAARIADTLQTAGTAAVLDRVRPLDHGVWVPLRWMYPQADVPVVQISLPTSLSPAELYKIGQLLGPLRKEGVLVVGSGGVVHNLRRLNFQGGKDAPVEPWAAAFDTWIAEKLSARDYDALLNFSTRAPHAGWAVPTPDHFLPIFITLGAAEWADQPYDVKIESIYEGFEYGSLSMQCFALESER